MGVPIYFRLQGTEMGLGSADVVSLAEAREKAHARGQDLPSGANPIDAKRKSRAAQKGKPTFGQIADALVEATATEWRNAKHRE
jgi:hypothetical protein